MRPGVALTEVTESPIANLESVSKNNDILKYRVMESDISDEERFCAKTQSPLM